MFTADRFICTCWRTRHFPSIQWCQHIEDFFKSYYGPNNCTLVLAGDIEPAKAKALVEKYFGSIP